MKDEPQQPAPVIVNASDSAGQQATFNKEAALQQRNLNMVDQYTPEGSVKYSPVQDEFSSAWEGAPGREHYGQIEDPTEGWIDAPIQRYSATQELSPEQQTLYDLSNQAATKYGEIGNTQLDRVRSSFEDPFSLESLGDAPVVNEATRTATRDAMLARLQPQMDRRRSALETSLVNQGFTRGAEGFDTAMDEVSRAENDAYLAADVGAGNEMARMYGLETSGRDRDINEILMQRNQPLSELASFMSGSQPQSPSFVPTPQGQVAAPDFMGAQYASAGAQNAASQNAYNQQMGSYNANLQGLYGLGGSAIGAGGYAWGQGKFSDRRLKKDIRKIGALPNGLNIYEYKYIWSDVPEVGLMADEVKLLHPSAVLNIGGYDAVNYAEAVR